jgi:protein-tyrosine-phosphatase/DNA-binding transcriptional ArsR family regulator
MNTEQIAQLEQRAAKHAALADPARLAIVDTLTLGDASPTELQRMLAMPSNLLAHHLKVLASAGLVERTRSEADRRRTYLHLAPGALEGIEPGAATSASRVVFVCTANSARSQLAAALWRRASTVPVASAGTHPAPRIDPGAVATAHRHDMPLRVVRPRGIDDVLTAGDLLVTVCDNAHEELGTGETVSGGGLHWSVPDPVRAGSDAAFDDTFADLSRRVGGLAARLSPA